MLESDQEIRLLLFPILTESIHMQSQTYFVSRKCEQDREKWKAVAARISALPGVVVTAWGRSQMEIEVSEDIAGKIRAEFNGVCDIELPVGFEPAVMMSDKVLQ
jgi:hypothetical protein